MFSFCRTWESMLRAPKPHSPDVARYEFVGLKVQLASAAKNRNIVRGEVISETKNTISIQTKKGVKRFPKSTSTFLFTLEDGRRVLIKGQDILLRPEDRLKKRVRKW